MARQWHPRAVAQVTLRGLQFIFAVISAALYGADVANWSTTNTHANASWIYAEVTAVLAALSSIAQWWLALPRPGAVVWDCVISLLWLVTVAVFAQNISNSTDMDQKFSINRIKAAVAIDGINLALWLASAVEACWCCGRKKQKQPTAEEAMEEVDIAEKKNLNDEGNVTKEKDAKVALDPPSYAKV
ncbi:uncharacterized protein NECHADRAFT_78710 [Fusarium vanettenii 77-13-4]|uniref:MARVEL domain-containing protein n=1 Tax=Fusarium vanettenii (strain ATCC MYA-4622 / CBS 123669 / FGSC 9596 / NRRL 45880 / 77-13-4) TaxID=660122 RepID=C7YPC7_FUSV7|nr:uncharacterized protein NECHADRAFT_78710 [Fusarium vanettenii 77-13-4]EEU46275.1 hypothetical protein NECHADRAFT_78710 [Fusarium vanettenii 77-13-4]